MVVVDVAGAVVVLDDVVASTVVEGAVLPAEKRVVGVGSSSPVRATIPTMAKTTTATAPRPMSTLRCQRGIPSGCSSGGSPSGGRMGGSPPLPLPGGAVGGSPVWSMGGGSSGGNGGWVIAAPRTGPQLRHRRRAGHGGVAVTAFGLVDTTHRARCRNARSVSMEIGERAAAPGTVHVDSFVVGAWVLGREPSPLDRADEQTPHPIQDGPDRVERASFS